jgi:hypothetical protein
VSKKKGIIMRKELHKSIVKALKAGRVFAHSPYALDAMEECDLDIESVIDLAVRASSINAEENFSYRKYSHPTCSIQNTTKSGAVVRSIWKYSKEGDCAILLNVYFCPTWFLRRIRR